MALPLVKGNPKYQQKQTRRDVVMILAGFCLAWIASRLAPILSALYSSHTLSSTTGTTATEIGFHPIHVYFGKMNQLFDPIPKHWWLEPSPNHKTGERWFSQHGQDIAVLKALDFKKYGYFVDLAANDAVWASNTFGLEQNFGWSGICIEGNPLYWHRLAFRNCHVVGGLAGGRDGEEVNVTLSTRKEAGPYGGLVGKDFDNHKVGRKDDMERRYTVSLRTILQKFNAPKMIDYLSLDVEGAETFIMRDFAWDEYTFRCLTIERPGDELRNILEKAGYKHALDIARGDTLWMHKSVYDSGMAGLQLHPEEIKEKVVKYFPKGIRSVRVEH